jgi:thiol-disulfide isomerase/thioredoxin
MHRDITAWVGILLAGALALGAGIYFGLQGSRVQDASPLLALSLPDIAGKEQSLEQWRGKVVVVNFWATWCAPCREEMPEFVKAQQEFGAKGLQFVGIAVDDADKVNKFVKEVSLNYPALVGGYQAIDISKSMGNKLSALPFTIVVDRQGNVAHTQLGQLKPAQLRAIVTKLL